MDIEDDHGTESPRGSKRRAHQQHSKFQSKTLDLGFPLPSLPDTIVDDPAGSLTSLLRSLRQPATLKRNVSQVSLPLLRLLIPNL